MSLFTSNPKRERGQGLVKYTIILALIAIGLIGIMHVLGPKAGDTFSTIGSSIDNVSPAEEIRITGSFEADDLYWNNPANGCNKDYTYGTDAGCDDIINRVRACLAGGTGPYCDDYFAVYPR